MKLSNLIKGTLVAAMIIAFAGCKVSVDATTPDFSDNEKNYTNVQYFQAKSGSISVNSNTKNWGVADKYEVANVSIRSSKRIAKDYADIKAVVDGAFTFYSLKDNETNKYCASAHDKVLTKTTDVTKVYTSGTDFITNVVFIVDASAVTTNEVAMICDASKLTDMSGAFILNLDGDEKAGEESDSDIVFFNISGYIDADGIQKPATALNAIYKENFRPNVKVDLTNTRYIQDTDGFNTALRLERTMSGFLGEDGVYYQYDKTFNTVLNEIFKVQFRAPGADVWTDAPALVFKYQNDADLVNNILPNTFYADVDLTGLETGTAIRLFSYESKPGLKDSLSKDYYGHQWYYSYGDSTYYEDSSNFDVDYLYQFKTCKYIVHTYNPTVTTAANDLSGVFDADIAEQQQNQILGVMKVDDTSYVIDSYTPLEEYAGFHLFDTANKVEYDFNIAVRAKNSDGKATSLYLTLKDSYTNKTNRPATLDIYVGEGTKLIHNIEYPQEVCFGKYPNCDDGVFSGLIKLN